MNGAIEVEVSPDGSDVYVVTSGDDAIVHFDRAAGGALTPVSCIDDNDTGVDPCAGSTDGLNDAAAVAVTADGKSVYVASFMDDAIVRFDRAADGSLTPQGCIDDNDVPFEGPDACAASTDGLSRAIGLAVTPDGKSVYVGSNGDDALTRFDRDTDGCAHPGGMHRRQRHGDRRGCTGSTDGLNGIFHVVSSPGGATIYTSAQQDSAVARFDRDAAGALTPAGCIDDNDTGADDCAVSTDGMGGAGWSDISADGSSLYVGAGGDSAVVSLGRESEPVTQPPGNPPRRTARERRHHAARNVDLEEAKEEDEQAERKAGVSAPMRPARPSSARSRARA